MIKTFPGTSINYGALLPSIGTVSDGALFFKTIIDVDGVTNPPGLYMYGFRSDLNPLVPGDQVGQGWRIASDLTNFVSKTGDIVTGSLTFTIASSPAISIQSTAPAIRFTETDQGVDLKNWLLVADGATFQIQSRNDAFTTSNTMFSVNRAGAGLLNGSQIWTEGNDGAGSGLDSDLLDGQHGSFYLNLLNTNGAIDINSRTSGALSVSRGGTNNTATVQGAVLYGASPSQVGYSTVGTAGQLLQSNGVFQPSWVNSNSLASGTANSLTTARQIALTGAVTGSAMFDGSANISISTTGASIPWGAISGLVSGVQTFASAPQAGFTTYARPSLFYDFGSASLQSLAPNLFPSASLTGFDSRETSDIGTYNVGLTVRGLPGAAQFAVNWNRNEAAPNSIRVRINDDSGATSDWGAWAKLWTDQDFSPSSYVLKSGDTMSGSLTVGDGAGDSLSVNGIALTWSNSSITTSGAITSVGNVLSTGGFVGASSGSGIVQAGLPGTAGFVRMQGQGSGTVSGYIGFFGLNQIRSAYIGTASNVGTGDSGNLNYVAGVHSLIGQVSISSTLGVTGITTLSGALNSSASLNTTSTINATGQITSQNDIVAYSDARIKTNIRTIENALDKVKALRGVSFDRLTGEHSTGVVAQEVQEVMPEVVHQQPDGMLGVAYGNMVGVLIEAIKAQQLQIDALRAEVQSLKA